MDIIIIIIIIIWPRRKDIKNKKFTRDSSKNPLRFVFIII